MESQKQLDELSTKELKTLKSANNDLRVSGIVILIFGLLSVIGFAFSAWHVISDSREYSVLVLQLALVVYLLSIPYICFSRKAWGHRVLIALSIILLIFGLVGIATGIASGSGAAVRYAYGAGFLLFGYVLLRGCMKGPQLFGPSKITTAELRAEFNKRKL